MLAGGGRPPDPWPFALHGSDLCPGGGPRGSLLAQHPAALLDFQAALGIFSTGNSEQGISRTVRVLALDQVTFLPPAMLGSPPPSLCYLSLGESAANGICSIPA